MLRPAGTPTPIESSTPQEMVETLNDALVKTLPAPRQAGPGLRVSWAMKRVLDASIALTALFLLLPLLLFIALLIWGSDGRSPIFRHKRLGRYGRPFGCLKFRIHGRGRRRGAGAAFRREIPRPGPSGRRPSSSPTIPA